MISADIGNFPDQNRVIRSSRHGAPYAQGLRFHHGEEGADPQPKYNSPFLRPNTGVSNERSRRFPKERHLHATEMPYIRQRTTSLEYASSLSENGALAQERSYRRHQMKRTRPTQWSVQDSDLFGRDQAFDFGVMGKRHGFNPRSPKKHSHKNSSPKNNSPQKNKPKETKQQKEVDKASKLLHDDLAKEKKAQDKAAAKSLKSLHKAENKAQKGVTKENKHEQKEIAKDQRKINKAKANLAKVEAGKGKSGKAGKAYAKAEGKLEKAEKNLAKQQAHGTKKLKDIDDKENKSIDKAGKKLDKEETKAHTDQFGKNGARIAKSHPTAWQKFKKVMAKIGNAIDWAITGISLLVPGAEEEGLARLTAKGAEMIAKKAAKEGAKKGAHAGLNKLQNEQQHKAVTAAKTESDAQVAAAEANAQKGKNEFNLAKQHAAHPAAGPRKRNASAKLWSFAV